MEHEQILKMIKKKTKLENFYELLNKKDYELIYQYYGKTIYNFFAPFEYKKEDIKKLIDDKNYALIFNKYGKLELFFIKDLKKYKKEDIKKLLKEGKYQEIYNKYGEKEYNKYIAKAYGNDIYNETNDLIKMKLYKTQFKLKSNLKYIIKTILPLQISSTIFFTMSGIGYLQNKSVNEEKFAFELMMYNLKNSDYADEINSLNLNDLQIIMKVMDDIWSNMDCYGMPERNVLGFPRLDLAKPGGKGVCRNIADDFTAKMNAINPEYNARNMIVYLDESYYTKEGIANINRKFDKNVTSTNESKINIATNILGDHMVSLIDIPNDNITLVIDNTNPTIGYLKNGKIYMLSMEKNKGLTYKPCGELSYALDNVIDINKKLYNSFDNQMTSEEIEEKYGTDSQNDALYYIRNLKNNKKY